MYILLFPILLSYAIIINTECKIETEKKKNLLATRT
jgi:hypothetical protein